MIRGRRDRHPGRQALLGAMTLTLGIALAGCGNGENTDRDAAPSNAPASPESSDTSTPSNEGPTDATPSAQDQDGPRLEVVSSDRGPSAVVSAEAGEGTKTRSGRLIIAGRGCLHVTNRGGPPSLLVLPPGAKIGDQRLLALELDGASYPVGGPVTLTGAPLTLDGDQAAMAARASPGVPRSR